MLERQVVLPASPEELWDALTEPDEVSAWFGARVDWDLRPGGTARFVDGDGAVRGGVVDDVQRGRYLRFRWWPLGDDAGEATSEATSDATGGSPGGGGSGRGSQVTYDLEADGEGTRLTVTERLMVEPGARPTGGEGTSSFADGGPQARSGQPGARPQARSGMVEDLVDAGSSVWTSWDGRLLRCWASVAAPVAVGVRRR